MFTFEEEKMSEELMKYHLRGFPFHAVIHKFTGADVGDPHDHPFPFTSFIIKGSYVERRWYIRSNNSYYSRDIVRQEGDSFQVDASTIHNIISLPEGECWTLIIPGLHERKWGFYQFGEQILHRFHDELEFHPYKQK